jgi:DNA processing protein
MKIVEIGLKNKSYPASLKALEKPPQKLWLIGQIPQTPAIAIVGTRKMTSYGALNAYRFSFELAGLGLTIVSGLARGIDTVAHKAALAAHGKTIAVLGSGIDLIYPPENRFLAQRISLNGALISQFPPGSLPLGKNFLARNGIISALSLAVLVIEGAQRSGTLSTATYAANQGKDVFALPGPVNSLQSEAPNFLIQNGATAVLDPKDIIDHLLDAANQFG